MNFLKILTVILFILATIVTVATHPQMHQPMVIEDAGFKVTRISDTIIQNEVPVTKIEHADKNNETQLPQKNTDIKVVEVQPQENFKQEKIVLTPQQQTPNEQNQLEILKKVIKNTEESVEVNKPIERSQSVQQPQSVQQHSPIHYQHNNPESYNPYMSAEEEIIAWNKWRSDIQNQIMIDSKIDYAPLGTMFLFSFIVDKYGNISNIKTWTSNSDYMDLARNNVKPAISQLQGKPILKFPKGTRRTSTVFSGAFLIGLEEKYSTPADYSDYERIIR